MACWLHHSWQGCVCERCGKVRDQDHDWEHCRCRRCGLNRQAQHNWQGCQCLTCGRKQHLWSHGVCTLCQERCTHEDPGLPYPDYDSALTAHELHRHRCPICGELQ
jgi:hypothetical protein